MITPRALVVFFQWFSGILSGFAFWINIDEKSYIMAALSLACVMYVGKQKI